MCGHELSGDDLSVVYTVNANSNTKENKSKSNNIELEIGQKQLDYKAESNSQGLLVLLDTIQDEDLEKERLARELINRIQRTRKKVSTF